MIVTFYSYKGGVGRSMALANVADLLARSGLRVLMVDFDLEAPGLEHFFAIDHGAVRANEGLLDLLLTFKHSMSTAASEIDGGEAFRRLERFVVTVYPETSTAGALDLLPAGRRATDAQITTYSEELRRFDWLDFYFAWSGELFFEWLRRTMTDRYDAVLVDSRTGLTEIGGVCAYQLADAIVVLCAPNLQNVDGTAAMVRHFASPKVRAVRGGREIATLVVPARVDQRADVPLHAFEQRFGERFDEYTPAALTGHGLRFWDLQIPYAPEFAFDEQVITDPSRVEERRELAGAYERLRDGIAVVAPEGSVLAELRPAADEDGGTPPRQPVETRYDPTTRFAAPDVFISFGRGSEAGAETIRELLVGEGLMVASSPRPGTKWSKAVSDQLRAAKVGVVVVGPRGDRSRRRGEELEILAARNTPVLPVLLEGATFEQIPPAAQRYAAMDLAAGPLRLVDAVRRTVARSETAPTPDDLDRRPYLGLAPFNEEDRDLLHGREEEVRDLLEILPLRMSLTLAGPSGAGKTSLVRAGLIPALRAGALQGSERWPVLYVQPGTHPLAALRRAFAGLVEGSDLGVAELTVALRGHERVVLVVDQVEELFFLAEPQQRSAFETFLDELLDQARGLIVPIFVIRSGLVTDLSCMREGLRSLLANQVVVSEPNDRALRRAIELPARNAGLALEPGLADRLLDDVTGTPGVLPLLQWTLLELWLRREGGYLTHRALEQFGGTGGLLASKGDDALRGLTDVEREAARLMLLLLVQPGDGREATARPWTNVDEIMEVLALHGHARSLVRGLLDRFVGARLLVASSDGDAMQIRIAHEALVRGWPVLRSWIDENWEAMRSRTQLRRAAEEWEARDRSPSALLDADRVRELRSSAGEATLTALQRAFVEASLAYATSVRGVGPWTRFVVEGVAGGPVQLSLADSDRVTVLSDIRYRGDTGLQESGLAAEDVARMCRYTPDRGSGTARTPTAGPQSSIFTWPLGPSALTPALVLHAQARAASDDPMGRVRVDRFLRFMLADLGVPFLRRWMLWSAAAFSNRYTAGGVSRLSAVVWLLIATGGVAAMVLATVQADVLLLIAAVAAPFAAASLWGSQWGAGLMAAIAIPALLPTMLGVMVARLVYRGAETVVGLFERAVDPSASRTPPPGWTGSFTVDGVHGGPIKLRQVGDRTFDLVSSLTYHGATGLEDDVAVSPSTLDRIRSLVPLAGGDTSVVPTVLASVPGFTRWFFGWFGLHTPAELLHGHLAAPATGPRRSLLDGEKADRYLRYMLKGVGVPCLRRWLLWSAVALSTRFVRGSRSRIATLVWFATVMIALAAIPLQALSGTDFGLPPLAWLVAWWAITTTAGAGLWGRQYTAGLLAGVSLPVVLLVVVPTYLAYTVYFALEYLIRLFVVDRARSTDLPESI